jgi:hypothetical protein
VSVIQGSQTTPRHCIAKAMSLVGDTGHKLGKQMSTLSGCSFPKFRQEFRWALVRSESESRFGSMIFPILALLFLFYVPGDFRSMLSKRSDLVSRLRTVNMNFCAKVAA